ncbi:MAG: O-antigen ligase family protein [Acidobacteria bacterium]|nr:O-antigen ligase family protein [Acidobacteriota bacterium]
MNSRPSHFAQADAPGPPWTLFALLSAATLTIWQTSLWSVRLLEAGVFLLCALQLIQSRGSWRFDRTTLAGGLLAITPVWGLLQAAAARAEILWDTLNACLYWSSLAGAFFLTVAMFRSPAVKRQVLNATALFAAAVCIIATLQFFTSHGRIFWIWPSGEPNVMGPFQSRNNYASFVLLTIPLVLMRSFGHAGLHWGWLAAAGAMLASVIASGSRAGAALILLETAIFFWIQRHRLGIRRRQLGAVLGLLLVMLPITGWDILRRKLNDSDPFRYRTEMISTAVSMAFERPAFGFGLGAFPRIYPSRAMFDSGHFVNHAHNDWAEWASEGGLPFLVLLAGFALCTLPGAFRSGWGLGLPAVYLHALVDYPFQRLPLACWIMLVAAAVLSSRHTHNAKNTRPA